MTTVRARIESLRSDTQFAEVLQAGEEWQAGNLVPADEVEARIAEAVAAERERCARIADESAKRNFIDTQMRCVFTAENIATAIRGGDHDG